MESLKEIENFIDRIPGRPKPRPKHSKMLFAIGIVLVLILSFSATGTVLTHYGKITTTASVKQAVKLDGKAWDEPIVDEIPEVYDGDVVIGQSHCLKNYANKDATVSFDVEGNPDLDGISVSYLNAELGTKGDATAVWADFGGLNCVAHLTTSDNVGAGDEGRVVINAGESTTLGDIESISWWEYLVKGYAPHVDIIIEAAWTTSGYDALVFEYAYNKGAGYHLDEGQPTYGSLTGDWYQTFSDDGDGPEVIDDSSYGWLSSGPAGGPEIISGTLVDWKSDEGIVFERNGNLYVVYKDTKVLRIEIEVDNWIAETEAYIDDVVAYNLKGEPLDGLTLTLEPNECFNFYIAYEFGDVIGDYTITTTVAKD